jgi:hypothetical protein
MAKNLDILPFLMKGNKLLGVNIGQTYDAVISKLGSPIRVDGDAKEGFIHYSNGIRFCVLNDQIVEIAIDFYLNKNIKYQVKSPLGLQFITEKSMIHEVIQIMNCTKLVWRSWDEKNVSLFSIRLKSNVFISFDLDTGTVARISFSDYSLSLNNQIEYRF